MSDDEVGALPVEYSTRAPTDYVVSGPIRYESNGRGRVFASADVAEEWAREKFGARFRSRIVDAERGGRWAMLIAKESHVDN